MGMGVRYKNGVWETEMGCGKKVECEKQEWGRGMEYGKIIIII